MTSNPEPTSVGRSAADVAAEAQASLAEAATIAAPGSTAADIERLRGEIVETLRELEDRLDVGKRVNEATERATLRLSELRRTKPLVFAAGVISAAALAGCVVWAVARKISRDLDL
ncbi:hypothetical protein GCM10022198_03020 [Klugiella xanthotipulae]|uniref:DUF3618 domain-containing protein n=1 Tax=Klugiella xanthotipulae TaxID=244735 RepID=UPI0011514528|nr:DUF3618 domain-containing protein [Klugiella xanthotipulae]